MSDTRVRVMIVSTDADFRRLAAAMLREAGYSVGTSDLRPERLAGRLRLPAPDVLLLEADPPAARRVLDVVGGHPAVVWAVEDPAPGPGRSPCVGKWWPPAELVAGLERALAQRRRPHLRLVGP